MFLTACTKHVFSLSYVLFFTSQEFSYKKQKTKTNKKKKQTKQQQQQQQNSTVLTIHTYFEWHEMILWLNQKQTVSQRTEEEWSLASCVSTIDKI